MTISHGHRTFRDKPLQDTERDVKPSRYNWRFAFSAEYDIWFNGFTGAAILADKETSANIGRVVAGNPVTNSKDPVVTRQSKAFVNLVQAGGFVIDRGFDEVEALHIRHLSGRFGRSRGIGLTIAPTMDCNLRCPYCYAYKHAGSRMSPDTCDAVIAFAERLIQQDKADYVWISYVGGEPLLAFDVMEDLTRRLAALCKANNCRQVHVLTTNGVLLSEKIISILTQKPFALRRLQITLDGPRSIHNVKRQDEDGGTYDRLISKLELLRGRCDVDVRINVDNMITCESVVELINDLHSRQLVGVFNEKRMIFYLAPIESTTDKCSSVSHTCLSRREFHEFARTVHAKTPYQQPFVGFPETKPHFCGLLSRNSFAIDPEGYVSKCWETLGNRDRSIGHVAEPLTWENTVWREWLTHDPVSSESTCPKCKFLPICMGGCPEVVMTQGRSENVCDHLKWEVEDRLMSATKTYLSMTQHRLGNQQLFESLVRQSFQGVSGPE